MSDNLKFSKMMSTDVFYKEIDRLVKNHNLSYMDAIVYYCEKNEIEIETAASMIKGTSGLNLRFNKKVNS